jgi:hypothetical protein
MPGAELAARPPRSRVAGTQQRGAVLSRVRDLIKFAGQQGYGREDVIQMIRDLPD